jgi:hypothetical protein
VSFDRKSSPAVQSAVAILRDSEALWHLVDEAPRFLTGYRVTAVECAHQREQGCER